MGSDSSTATYTLVGQVLDNDQTNFVGYDEGDALYLLTTSASGATPTTLGDGQSYFYTSGSAPSGYLATDGGNAASQTSSGDASMTTSGDASMTMSDDSTSSETRATGTEPSSNSEESMSSTSEASASAETSQPGAGNRLSVVSVGVGMTLFTALVFGVMG